MKQPIYLRIYFNGKLENVRQFTEDQVIVGRGEESHLKFTDESISPVHAVIEARDSGYYVSDLGSQLGTFKNGHKVFDEAIQSGDELQFGPYKVEFFVGVPKPTQAPKGVSVPPAPVENTGSLPTPPPITTKAKKESTQPSISIPTSSFRAGPDLRKSRGTIVEVTVLWKDRVIATHHFNEKSVVTIGSSEDCTIEVPMLGSVKTSHTLLQLAADVTVFISPEMSGEYHKEDEEISIADLKRKNRMLQSEQGFAFVLNQTEALRLGLHGDLLSICIRYVQEMPPPLLGPLFDLSASESTAVLMSAVIAAIFGLYMLIYTPKPLEDENKLEQQLRKATITFSPPKKKIVQVVEEQAPQEKKVVKVDMKAERTTTKPDPGKASDLRPVPNPKKTPIASSTIKQGGSINTGKPAANAKSETKDVSKLGLLSTFGGKGTQKELSKAYSGTGELLGDAAKATGYSGSAEDRAGESLGGRLKNVGAGGKGTATYGIAGVGTQGKGTGGFGNGTGGIGKKGRVDLNIGESEAEFTGSIDREAIRKVIRDNIKLFQNCYDQALRKNSDAYGKVEIKWHIEERGRATHASVKSNSVGDSSMGQCLTRVITSLTFPEPPPDQIAEVVYPFVFASQ